MPIEVLAQPGGLTAGDRVLAELASGRWNDLRWTVAFAKLSGVKYVDAPLRAFTAAGGRAIVSVGIDQRGTSFEAASQLAGSVARLGHVVITKDIGSPPSTFHPKAYLFRELDANGDTTAAVLVSGSSNLTEGGLFTNYEMSTAWTPDLSVPSERDEFDRAVSTILRWQDTTSGLAVLGDSNGLVALHSRGDLPTEASITAARAAASAAVVTTTGAAPATKAPAGLTKVPRPPTPNHPKSLGPALIVLPPAQPTTTPQPTTGRPRSRAHSGRAGSSASTHSVLYIDISTTSMTELYLAKTALDDDPAFFGHPFTGLTTPKKVTSDPQPERDPRPIVDIRLLDATGAVISKYQDHPLKIWQYAIGKSANQDIRVTVPQELLRALPPGCILEMRRTPVRRGIEYQVDFLTPGSVQHAAGRAAATQLLPGGKRRWGWG